MCGMLMPGAERLEVSRYNTGVMAERGVEDLYRAARITSRSAETPLAAGAHRQLVSEIIAY